MAMNRRLFKYLSKDMLKGLGIFWLVITIVNMAATAITYYFSKDMIFGPVLIINGENVLGNSLSYAGSNLFAIFIFFIVYGIIIYYENFSLAGSFGVTRKNFYLHVIVNNILIVGVSAVVQIILLKIDNMIVSRIGYEPISDFGLFNMNDNILVNILLLGFVFLVFTSLTNLIGTLQYRFGPKFWIVFGLIVFIFIGNPFGFVSNGFVIFTTSVFDLRFLAGLFIILLAYGLGFMVFRRVNVK